MSADAPPDLVECLKEYLVDDARSNVPTGDVRSEHLNQLAQLCLRTYPQWPRLKSTESNLHLHHHETALSNFLRNRIERDRDEHSAKVVPHPTLANSLADELHKAYTATHEELTYYAALDVSSSHLGNRTITFGPWQIRTLEKVEKTHFNVYLRNFSRTNIDYILDQCLWLVGRDQVCAVHHPIENAIRQGDLNFRSFTKTYTHYPDLFSENCVLTLLLFPWEEIKQRDGNWMPFSPPKFVIHHSDPLQPLPALKEDDLLRMIDEVERGVYRVNDDKWENLNCNILGDIDRRLDQLWHLVSQSKNSKAADECKVFRHFFIRAFFDAANIYLGFDQVLWHLICIDALCDRKKNNSPKDNNTKDKKGKFIRELLKMYNDEPSLYEESPSTDPSNVYVKLMDHRDEYVHGKLKYQEYDKEDILKARTLARRTIIGFLRHCTANKTVTRDKFVDDIMDAIKSDCA